ncbi:hypothetical protein SDC9_189592 [bioreactor metagenome]|uniref:Uncharacterized protein n=1 Tax=bioreactor metagenome TaxID=1076179 RepID=A0A645HTY9_9ZZZZ
MAVEDNQEDPGKGDHKPQPQIFAEPLAFHEKMGDHGGEHGRYGDKQTDVGGQGKF